MFLVNQNNSCVFSFKRRRWNGGWLKDEVISEQGKKDKFLMFHSFRPSAPIITVPTSSFCSYSQIFSEDFDQESSTTLLIAEQVGLSLAFCSCAHWWLEKQVGYEILNSGYDCWTVWHATLMCLYKSIQHKMVFILTNHIWKLQTE